jgi:hypothetical protein
MIDFDVFYWYWNSFFGFIFVIQLKTWFLKELFISDEYSWWKMSDKLKIDQMTGIFKNEMIIFCFQFILW